MTDRQRKTEYVLTALAALLILAYLAVFGLIGFRGFAHLATADMYEDTLVARLMWEEKSLFPKSFLFGNQVYVAATPVLAALFYGLTGSMNRGMVLASVCMSLLLLWSMDWMLRPFLRRRSLRLMALLAFLAVFYGPDPVTREDGQQLFCAMCSFYACYLICFFVVLGDYARARTGGGGRASLVLSLLLCFCMGMQSLRQTCVLILPLLGFEALSALGSLRKGRGLFPAERRPLLRRVLLYTAANLAGLAVIRLLPVRMHTIYRGASVFSGASLGGKFRELHKALVTVSGYDYTREGAYRLFYILMFLFMTGLVLAALWLLLRRGKALSGSALRVFWLIALLGCLCVVAASFFTSVQLRPIYLFLYYILPALSLALIAERAGPKLTGVLCAGLCVLAAANLFFSYRGDVERALDTSPTYEQEICDWAVENGYELVYGAQSSTAPYVAVRSDGALTAGCWEDEVIFKLSPHINIRDVYSLADYERAIFVFLPSELEAMRTETEANGTEMTFCGQFGDWQVYTSSKQLMYPITETIDFKPEYN